MPITELMAPFGRQPAVMQNTVALSTLAHLADLDFDFLKGVISDLVQRKGEEVINTNYAAYPMTPASSILHFMANHAEKYGIVVMQMEDEIGSK